MQLRRAHLVQGLLWIIMGGLLLINSVGDKLADRNVIAVYWPSVLIVLGVSKIITRRQSFSAIECGGTFVLLAFGLTQSVSLLHSRSAFDLWQIAADQYSYQEYYEQNLPPGSTIEILNLAGDTEIRSSNDNLLKLDIRRTIRAMRKVDADKLWYQSPFSIHRQGMNFRVSTVSAQNPVASENRGRSLLLVQVPPEVTIRLENRQGNIKATGLRAGLVVENRSGNSTIEDVLGSVQIRQTDGSVFVKQVTGTVTILNRHGQVNVLNIKGSVAVSNLDSPVWIESITGPVAIVAENSSLIVRTVSGSLDAQSSYQNVTVFNTAGPIRLWARHADVNIVFKQMRPTDISIIEEYGTVHLQLPDIAFTRFLGKVAYGNISSSIRHIPMVEAMNRLPSVPYSLKIRVYTGDINLHTESTTIYNQPVWPNPQ